MFKILNKNFVWLFIALLLVSSGFFVPSAKAQFEQIIQLFYGDSDVPVILPRSTWDNTASLNALMTWPPQNSDYPSDWQPVERIIVHDTGCDTGNVTCNNNQAPIATIQAIYRYHAVTRGWGDIGYNYIIDQQGRIYEGRYGGNGVRGAHTYYDRQHDNFNFGSIGISILGNYGNVAPPQAALDSLTKLVAWLAAANNLDSVGQANSYIWNTDKGGFATFYSGPLVVGHKDLEPGNPDPGMIDFAKLRQDVAPLAAKIKNYIYQTNGDSRIYKVERGTRQAFTILADYTAQGNSYSRMVNLSTTQLALFSENRFLKYPDGSLLQIKDAPTIYLIDGGKKRSFNVTAAQFTKLGFDFRKVKQVTADEFINYLDGLAIKYGPDKSLISDGAKVYFVENGKKRWVTSAKLFALLNYQWSKVKQMPASQVQEFLEEQPMAYPDGTLARASDSPAVYLIKNAQKHEFVSEQSFVKLGYKKSSVKIIDAQELVLYPSGSIVAYSDGTLIKSIGAPTVFLVEKGMARPFLSGETFENLKYKWSQILSVTSQELSYYPQGEPVKYREGALLRKKNENTVYVISGGKPQAVDTATFKKRKYQWANVLVMSASEFDILYGKASTIAVTPPVSPTATTTPADTATSVLLPKIRVALFEVTAPSVTFTANVAYDILNKSGQIIASKKAQENYIYNIATPGEAFIKIVPQSADGAVEIISFEDHPAWKPTLNYNKFRGAMEIVWSQKSNKIWAVNELLLEDYLRGIAETVQGDPMEYQKTMMVAARTYAYYYWQKGGKHGSDEVYQLIRTSGDQLYKGYGREIFAPDVSEAVRLTRGEIASFNGQPIVAAYSSGAADLITLGSRSACSVWGGQFCQSGFEYLAGGVKDPDGTQYSYSSCSGSNHCVGLSGAGTRQFAKLGSKNYQEILKYYYPGVEIKKIY